MGNYIKKASIRPLDTLQDVNIPDVNIPDVNIPDTNTEDADEPVIVGSLSLKEQIEKMESDSADSNIIQVNPIEVQVSPVETMKITAEKIKPKKFTFEPEKKEVYSSLSEVIPHTPKNSPVPSPCSNSGESVHSTESPDSPLSPDSPTIQDIISSRFWKVKEDFEDTHKIIYDMMKELML